VLRSVLCVETKKWEKRPLPNRVSTTARGQVPRKLEHDLAISRLGLARLAEARLALEVSLGGE
jgi:hypothetical protein